MTRSTGTAPGVVAPAREERNVEDAGQKLRRARERLNLRYRDVEEASLRIAERHKNDEFIIALSRLADIENKGTVPTLYRLYSLCVIYRLDLHEVLGWYGVDLTALPADVLSISLERTHPIDFPTELRSEIMLPLSLEPGLDLRRTTYLSRMVQRWGKLPLMLLDGLDLKNHRYGFVGTEDWSMYPLLQPGSFVVIDETHRKIVTSGWTHEFERPIYFFEHRKGYACCWCNLTENHLVLQPHPSSLCNPEFYSYPDEIDVIGQVTGLAMRLDQGKRRRIRP